MSFKDCLRCVYGELVNSEDHGNYFQLYRPGCDICIPPVVIQLNIPTHQYDLFDGLVKLASQRKPSKVLSR